MTDIFIQSTVGGSWSIDIGKDGESKVISVHPGVQTITESEHKSVKDDPGFAARIKKGQFVILNKKEADKKDKAEEKAKEATQKANKEVEELKEKHKKEISKLKTKFNDDQLHLSNLKKEVDNDLKKSLEDSAKLKIELDELKKLLDEATK